MTGWNTRAPVASAGFELTAASLIQGIHARNLSKPNVLQPLLRQAFHRIDTELRVFVAHLLGFSEGRRIKRGSCLFHALENHHGNAWLRWLTKKGDSIAPANDVFGATIRDRFRCG